MQFQRLAAIFTMLLLASVLFAQDSAQLKIDVVDKSNHVVSDALIIANYQELKGGNLTSKQIVGATDTGGSFDTTILFEENSTPASHMFIEVYHPYWSSGSLRVTIPKTDEKIISQKIKIPFDFETYRIRVSDKNGTALSSFNVQLLYPFFLSKKTEANGIVQFRVPKGIIPYGRLERKGEYQSFSFQQDSQKTNFLSLQYPFTTPNPLASDKKYSLILQVFDSQNEPLTAHPFIVSINGSNATYFSDSHGNLRVSDIPQSNLTLHWNLYSHTYSKFYNLEDDIPKRLVSDQLLKIHSPSILHLGESCYRVEVNITDPREGALKQVVAKALDGNKTIAITLEQNQTVNKTHISFNRIFCVAEDTSFDIIASSPYENATLTIKLLKVPEEFAPPPPQVVEGVGGSGIPDFAKEQAEEQKKVELLVILVELLVILILAYLAIRFRKQLIYYLGAIMRFVYLFAAPLLNKKLQGKKKV